MNICSNLLTMDCDKFITLSIIYIFCVDQLPTWDSAHNYHWSRSEVNCEGGQIRRGGYRSYGSPLRSSSQRKYEKYHSHFSPSHYTWRMLLDTCVKDKSVSKQKKRYHFNLTWSTWGPVVGALKPPLTSWNTWSNIHHPYYLDLTAKTIRGFIFITAIKYLL